MRGKSKVRGREWGGGGGGGVRGKSRVTGREWSEEQEWVEGVE